ncbi:MAG: glycine zipper 2TM domain-containing protein [Pseudomonadota bacterium]
MNAAHSKLALVLGTAAVLAGCASSAPSPSSAYSSSYGASASAITEYGRIDAIELTRANGTTGGGAVVGGVLGALAGNQVGSGSGRTAATVAGAAGGALIGNQVEANRGATRDVYQVSIRLDNGDYRNVTQDSVADLRVGDRVRVVDGRAYRY